jgi:hypothetical protein
MKVKIVRRIRILVLSDFMNLLFISVNIKYIEEKNIEIKTTN